MFSQIYAWQNKALSTAEGLEMIFKLVGPCFQYLKIKRGCRSIFYLTWDILILFRSNQRCWVESYKVANLVSQKWLNISNFICLNLILWIVWNVSTLRQILEDQIKAVYLQIRVLYVFSSAWETFKNQFWQANLNIESESEVTQSCPTLCNPMDCRLPGFSVHGFSRQEFWSGLPFPSPGYLPNPGIESRSPALWADTLPSEPPGKLVYICVCVDTHTHTRTHTHTHGSFNKRNQPAMQETRL